MESVALAYRLTRFLAVLAACQHTQYATVSLVKQKAFNITSRTSRRFGSCNGVNGPASFRINLQHI